jgi:DNA repair exonuclease SbcCD ATPase subunit
MHITYDSCEVPAKTVDEDIKKQIEQKQAAIKIIELHNEKLNARVKQLEEEKIRLTSAGAQFASFLQLNAIAPFNDAMADYLDHMIKVEKDKTAVGGDSRKLEGLEKMRERYSEQKRILEDAGKHGANVGSAAGVLAPEDIRNLMEELYKLEFSGPMIKDAMRVAEESKGRSVQGGEKRFNVCRQ